MYLGLYLKQPEIKPGCYPQAEKNNIKSVKIGTINDSKKIGQFFYNNINNECGLLTAPFEYDYWNSNQCKKLVEWINNNQPIIKGANLDEFFEIINDYCKKAVELNTGVEIDL